MNSHTATINPGTYNSNIGTTTISAFCNDADGFALYAIGYTNSTEGNNTLSSTTSATPITIPTGTALSGDSQWAMKLTTDSGATYPITIENGFSSFHTVPNEYTMVAKRTSSTDIGAAATGSVLTTTYQAFISSTQTADTYTGKVKYILIHPNYVDPDDVSDAVTMVFSGNNITFPNGQTTNTVKYANVCKPGEYAYVGNTYEEVMTSNILSGGEQDGPYTDDEHILETRTLSGADKIKVVVNYKITMESANLIAIPDTWDGDWDNWNNDWDGYYDENDNWHDNWIRSYDNNSGKKTYIIDGDTVTIYGSTWSTPTSSFDYGFYVRIYPVYDTEQPGTTGENLPTNNCSIQPISGTYMEPTTWNGKWIINNTTIENETELDDYIVNNFASLSNATINAFASDPYTIIYNGNNDDGDTSMSITTEVDFGLKAMLAASNYIKSGYGFAGWSAEQLNPDSLTFASELQSAISDNIVFGPNEDLELDANLMSYANNNKEIILYAIWVKPSGNLQNWNGCSSMNVGDVTALTDLRDNDVYAVAKLADSNCWMIENLRLDYDADFTESLSQGFGKSTTYGDFVGLPEPRNLNRSIYCDERNDYNSIYYFGTQQGTAYINIGTDCAGRRIPDYDNENTHNTVSDMTGIEGENIYSYGNMYSFSAALANTIYYQNPTDVIDGKTSDTVNTSICPAGWRLPYGGSTGNGAASGGYSYLDIQLGGDGVGDYSREEDIMTALNRWRSFPNNFIYSNPEYGGIYGRYWSSTVVQRWYFSYTLSLVGYDWDYGNMLIYPGNGYQTGDSRSSVRCVNL